MVRPREGGGPTIHARRAVIASGFLAAAVTVTLLAVPTHLAASRDPRRVAADTIASAAAMLVAVLVHGRFRRQGLIRDAVFSSALFMLALATFAFTVGPALVQSRVSASAAPVTAGVLAAAMFCLASFLPSTVVAPELRTRVAMAGLAVAGLGIAMAALFAAFEIDHLFKANNPGSADTFGIAEGGEVRALQGVAAALFALAIVGCLRVATRDDDHLAGAFAIAAVFAVASRIEYAAAQSLTSRLVTSADILRLAFYAILIVAAGLEIRTYWQRLADAAVQDERRRIARDLHDGLAQELAFVASQSRVLANNLPDSRRAGLVCAAAERALDESRRAIAALTSRRDEPLDVALAQTAEELANRLGARLTLDLEPGADRSPAEREALLRIAREAITNAGRHGHARRITVRLYNGDGLTMRIEDNGIGFDTRDLLHLSGRLGLLSMRERAEAMGGEFSIESRIHGGTAVAVHLK